MSHRLARLLCFALCAALPTLSAKEEATPVPTEITSKHFESRSTDTEMTTLFTGDVVVTGTNLRITCDRIEVISMRLGEKSDVVTQQNRFKSLVATGNVKIAQADREANCGRAVVLPGDDKITLTENPIVIDHGANITWTGDSLMLLRGERRVLGNNVRLVGPPVRDLGFDPDKKVPAPATPAQPAATQAAPTAPVQTAPAPEPAKPVPAATPDTAPTIKLPPSRQGQK